MVADSEENHIKLEHHEGGRHRFEEGQRVISDYMLVSFADSLIFF
jgi:hypothetical protein